MLGFRSKSETLASLSVRLRSAQVLEQATVTVGQWRRDPEAALSAILARPWASGALIVRSSVSVEDTFQQSLAGHFASVATIRGRDELRTAIGHVVASYGEYQRDGELVLVQPMLQDVDMSGVAVSREAGSGRPYYVVNYSSGTDTAAVTAGRTNDLEVFYFFRAAPRLPEGRLGAVVRLIREIEDLTGTDAVDVEFAFCRGQDVPYLLQARPLAAGPNAASRSEESREDLARVEGRLAELFSRNPLCFGKHSVLGVMPDWNPAEIIGVRPRPLALSLYRHLITDSTWAHQRKDYGYRDLRGFPLLVDLLGLPYVDVRASFNSFVPAALDDDTAERLVDYYLGRLLAAPALHDKVEFEIVFSCYTFDLQQRLARLRGTGFSRDDCDTIRDALLDLTRRVMDPADGPWHRDRAEVAGLGERRARIHAAGLSPVAKVYWLLEDCRLRGTRPFAGLARAAFIAVQILDSLVAVGAIGAEERREFLMSLHTVTSRMQHDLALLSREAFLGQYGHLRPGTYDILSPRYDERPDFYFGSAVAATGGTAEAMASNRAGLFDTTFQREIGRLLACHDLRLGPADLTAFLSSAICDREAAKFEFSRNLSDALAEFAAWGADLGFSADELSYSDIDVVRRLHQSTDAPRLVLEASIDQGRRRHAASMQTMLPPLVTSPQDVWGFHLPVATPTFVTMNTAVGTVVADLSSTIDGCIVMLPNADPGFDWIFTRGIAGFVTAYGGANSHMAIRASELDLPAVIGAGERLFARWSKAPALRLDCANRMVEILLAFNRHEARRCHAAC